MKSDLDLAYFEKMISVTEVAKKEQFEETEFVYHYTSIETFSKIIKSQSLWFTDSRYLNDSKEFKHGKDVIVQIIKGFRLRKNKAIGKIILENLYLLENFSLYTFCFSKEPDLLSQWTRYSNNGKGLCFGIKLSKLKSVLGPCFISDHVIYDNKSQEKRIEQAILESIEYFKNEKINSMNINSIIQYFSYMIATYKHVGFEEEKEYRCFIINNNKENHLYISSRLDAYITDGICKPYLNVQIENGTTNEKRIFPIENISIGPVNDLYASEIYLSKLLTKNGYPDLAIKKSNIPYRNY
jgi:hypothetical protein